MKADPSPASGADAAEVGWAGMEGNGAAAAAAASLVAALLPRAAGSEDVLGVAADAGATIAAGGSGTTDALRSG